MAFKQVLNHVVAFATTLLLLEKTMIAVQACRCLAPGLYEGFESADVVLHATALNRSEQLDTNGLYTYTLDVITIYKEESDVTYAQEVSFTTHGSELLCGVTLEVEEEYLLGLYRINGLLTADTCGLVWDWSSVTDDDVVSLEGGCEDDPCDELCGEFQECLYYPFDSPGVYYCADVCDPSPCADGEVCTFEDVECVDAPCPPTANCTTSSD